MARFSRARLRPPERFAGPAIDKSAKSINPPSSDSPVPNNSPGSPSAPMLDVVIVGGGPAGLSAALILGRCRRRVLVCDAGHPRNRVSHGVNGFLTRDGLPPEDLRRIARADLAKYPNVEVRDIEVCDADLIE